MLPADLGNGARIGNGSILSETRVTALRKQRRRPTLAEIVAEMRATRVSERSDRAVDHDGVGSMEQKKLEGYF